MFRDEWGGIGLAMLLTFRAIQGLSTGGEIAGVSVFLAEYHDKQACNVMVFIILAVLSFHSCCWTTKSTLQSATPKADISQQVLGFMSSSISFGGAFGFALSASVVSLLLSVLDDHQMNLWGWRIPFITCIFPGLVSLALRCVAFAAF
jgi:MFS family permease